MTKQVFYKEKFIQEILHGDYQGSWQKCATSLGISRQYLFYFITSEKTTPGPKLTNAIVDYCDKSGRNPHEYFLIANSSTTST